MIAKKSPLNEMQKGTRETVLIKELPPMHTIDLRVEPGSPAHASVVQALDIHLPEKPGKIGATTLANENNIYTLCLAPDWWMILGLQQIESKLGKLSNDQHHFSAVDVSGQRTIIAIEGKHAREVLAHLWEQDLREKNFPVLSVSQGLMAKAPVILCYISPLRYFVIVRSSFALHLWKALADAAEEWI